VLAFLCTKNNGDIVKGHIRSIGIFYFSGTGNTKAVTEMLATSFKEQGCTVDVIAIDEIVKNKKILGMENYDIIGFGYPVHALNAPRIFFEFLALLPEGNQKKIFVFKSAGDPFMNGGSTALVRTALHKKGYIVTSERLFVMPANVLVRYRDSLIKQLYNTAIRRGKTMVTEILFDVPRLQKNTLFSTSITAVFSALEGFGGRFFGKHLYCADTCNSCGICVQSCPTNNITLQKNRIIFDLKCTFCMRCIYSCPLNAISPRFLRFLVIKPWYNLQKIVSDQTVKDSCITDKTKGYFKHFNRYLSEE
jgi:ferredoxin/flavodoxin